MGHTFNKLYFHCVFSTKARRPLIRGPLADRIGDYLGATARNMDVQIVRCGGFDEHRHFLLMLKPTILLSDTLRVLKTNSSKWIHETFPDQAIFEWQAGYSAFTVSHSLIDKTIEYIENQQEHHRKTTFEEELKKILDWHGITYEDAWLRD